MDIRTASYQVKVQCSKGASKHEYLNHLKQYTLHIGISRNIFIAKSKEPCQPFNDPKMVLLPLPQLYKPFPFFQVLHVLTFSLASYFSVSLPLSFSQHIAKNYDEG